MNQQAKDFLKSISNDATILINNTFKKEIYSSSEIITKLDNFIRSKSQDEGYWMREHQIVGDEMALELAGILVECNVIRYESNLFSNDRIEILKGVNNEKV